jgi:hypothetical protein
MRAATCLFSILAIINHAWASETNQFSVPPQPLKDIGAAVCDEVLRNIEGAIARVNAQPLDKRASAYAVMAHVYDSMGEGLPTTTLENWLNHHNFGMEPVRYWRSLLDAPTVNIFGVYQGTDKLSHALQQGMGYMNVTLGASAYFEDGEHHELQPNSLYSGAVKKAVAHGVSEESSFFGITLTGVYSNADLAANYMGMRLYENLTSHVRVGQQVLPPIVIFENGWWKVNPSLDRRAFLKPYISQHLDESLNPSYYSILIRGAVKLNMANNCESWLAFYGNPTASQIVDIYQHLSNWNGEDYGHYAGHHVHSLWKMSDVCF